MTADRPSRDQRDLRERIARRFFRTVNPLILRMIPAGVPTGAPNVLLLVRGRRSGIERTMPVTLLDFEGHSYVQATYGAPGWGRNLRAAGEATMIRPGGRRSAVRPVEIPSGEAAAILQRALRRITVHVSYAGCSARVCDRRLAFYVDTGSASMTPHRTTSPKLSATRCSSSDPRNDYDDRGIQGSRPATLNEHVNSGGSVCASRT
jgi:deazaflavin-dependent oxidoreductase (nitroreductase family)